MGILKKGREKKCVGIEDKLKQKWRQTENHKVIVPNVSLRSKQDLVFEYG